MDSHIDVDGRQGNSRKRRYLLALEPYTASSGRVFRHFRSESRTAQHRPCKIRDPTLTRTIGQILGCAIKPQSITTTVVFHVRLMSDYVLRHLPSAPLVSWYYTISDTHSILLLALIAVRRLVRGMDTPVSLALLTKTRRLRLAT